MKAGATLLEEEARKTAEEWQMAGGWEVEEMERVGQGEKGLEEETDEAGRHLKAAAEAGPLGVFEVGAVVMAAGFPRGRAGAWEEKVEVEEEVMEKLK